MQGFGGPLMAIVASFGTWMWMDRQQVADPTQSASSPADLANCQCDMDMTRRADHEGTAAGVAFEPGRAGDPLRDAADASQRSLFLLRDSVAHVLDVAAAVIWPWPADTDSALPLAAAPLGDLASTFFSEVKSHADFVVDKIPPAVVAPLQGACQLVFEMVAVPVRSVVSWARSSASSALEGFLESHPEHRAAIDGRDPLLTMLLLLALALATIWELYGCLRVVWLVVRRFLGLAFRLVLLPCGVCCRRRPNVPPQPVDVVQDVPLKTEESWEIHEALKASEGGA
eukprot:CAMPEP_0117495486 /NCGR_PEP_ID=MMETSP0784-20121206/20158_1 /TAXON_ID=39447 /ORGANISM="" /LENGTH=284 /DNA_ID=CAMNT_0005290411 /DNA_START=53 /DNA_END=907 /DNA_ORIENTATION=+